MDTQNLLSIFIGYFIAVFMLMIVKNPDDHDDGPGGGMLQPVYDSK